MKNNFFGIQWHVNNFCNLRCQHCYQESFSLEDEVSYLEIKEAFEKIKKILEEKKQFLIINLTGGEPFFKKDFWQIVELFEKDKIVKDLQIITNGTILNSEIIKNLKKIKKISTLKISLEGAKYINDKIRGEGVFDKVFENILTLKKETKLKIVIMFTAMKINLEEISFIFHFARENMLEGIIVERFIPKGRGWQIKDFVLDKDDWQKLVEKVCFLSKFDFQKENLFFYRAFWIKFVKNKIHLFGAKCNLGKDALCIMPNLTVFPCRRFNLACGNLKENSFNLILARIENLVKEFKHYNLKGKCKICKKNCFGCRALGFSLENDYFAEDFHCFL